MVQSTDNVVSHNVLFSVSEAEAGFSMFLYFKSSMAKLLLTYHKRNIKKKPLAICPQHGLLEEASVVINNTHRQSGAKFIHFIWNTFMFHSVFTCQFRSTNAAHSSSSSEFLLPEG